ncbi:PREDICTED: synaptic vesicle glycoprotein 2A-like isoform X2 [Papilio xuthus]|uniref:Synaptic vesicle glycoprotein 2A-like isoform X2 n=1 Tax=Papilio xuthus TaxID=66420 RepID=A0AAJ7E8G8_PAPXU|nr:PREDICTED: synaptic vesicle glycoprotein 2A-like isoform X2 [Papilio xuthus]
MLAENNENMKSITAKCSYDEALNSTGFGRYNYWMLCSCNLLILAMYLDIFGFSVALPAAACDMRLTITQQGLLSAVPLIGVMLSSYAWGLCADTLGRRRTLLIAMPIGAVMNLIASVAPTYASLAVLKFLSAGFTSSANAAAFVLLGETTPTRHRSRFLFLMASATMYVQLVICLAIPVFKLSFDVYVPLLSLNYRPWRLLMLIISLPGILGVIGMVFLHESPKFLLSSGKEDDAVNGLKKMYSYNTIGKNDYYVTQIFLEEATVNIASDVSFVRKMWNQTAPLFKPPLLKNSLKLYYLLLSAYMTSTGYTMWVPTMTNAYFNGEDNSGKTFCDVASTSTSNVTVSTNCNSAVQPLTLYAVACYSAVSGSLNIILSFVVGSVGKKKITILIFIVSVLSGLALIFVTLPLLSIALFYFFNYVSLILGTVNTYLVELNPTYLRGMATCLSVVVARGFGFISVQLIASLLSDHCTPMISGYVVLVMSGLAVTFSLPADATNKVDPANHVTKSNDTTKTRC